MVLVGLSALAFTQPILDLMGRNPEFFVAGRYTNTQIVLFGVLVTVVPAAVLVAVHQLARLLGRRVQAVVFGVLVATLGAVFGNVLLRGVGVDRTLLAAGATLAGGLAVFGLTRTRGGALLLQYLAAAQLFFLFGFLVISPTAALLQGGAGIEAIGDVRVPEPPGPVVVVVFDELPLSTLMKTDGTINEERYPTFARLEATSTWYRNASTNHERTERAVPGILTGLDIKERVVPTFRELPRNLFSLLSRAIPVERYEAVTDLCPPDACEDRPGQPVTTALNDALVVYGHRVLPPTLREGLAPIDNAWGEFGDAVGGGAADEPAEDAFPLDRFFEFEAAEREAVTQNRRLVEIGATIDGSPAFHFAHVVTPHAFWSATPWGTVLMKPWPGWVVDPDEPGYEWSELNRFQRHSLQVGSADVALGSVLDRLDASGSFEDATIVVAADHGTSTLGPDFGRDVINAGNEDEIYRIPLFIKAPGQTEGEVVDEPAQLLDILPTLIDLLDIDVDWEMDGHSLVDGSERTVDLRVSADVEPLFDLVERHREHFPNGWDWVGLVSVGDHASLVGTDVADLEIGEPSEITWDLENEAAFASLPTDEGEVPQLVRGRIQTPDGDAPPDLVVAVNGVVAGVTGTYGVNENGWSFSSMLGPFLVDGENTVAAYEVSEGPSGPVLHRVG